MKMKKMKQQTALIAKVKSLGELRRLAESDVLYLKLAYVAASNLGWTGRVSQDRTALDSAMRWLSTCADETNSERGVVAEVNFVRDCVR
jgi:hypothetical protein